MTTTLNKHEECSQDGPSTERFPAQEISDKNCDSWIHVRVGAYFGWGLVVNEPDIGGECDDRAGNYQVGQCEPCSGRNGSPVEAVKFTEHSRRQQEHYSAD
jgi:hypothetical protein